MLRTFSGAVVRRVVDRSRASIPEHAHDWPLLSLFVMGGYSSRTELGETTIHGPSVVLYRAGAFHRNVVGAEGFEQIEIEFDPAWLGATMPERPVSQWIGGCAGADARRLARTCEDADEKTLRASLQRFLATANDDAQYAPPAWVNAMAQRLRADAALSVTTLAREAARHPSWAGTVYRQATGERMAETAARLRVERAARLLRETEQSFAAIAAASGFCDQSHMNRCVRRVLSRTPSAVREDGLHFRHSA
jgi:AraC family transcriptional regulator